MFINPKMNLTDKAQEDLEKIKDKNKPLHKAILETAVTVFDILESNKIKWVLHGGSALGAFLYRDFIPWDDDLDIAIPWEERDKLLKILKKELPSNLELLDVTTNTKYQYPFPKVINKNYPLAKKEFGDSQEKNYVWIDFAYYTKTIKPKKNWRITFFGKWMWLREAKIHWFINLFLIIFKIIPQKKLCKKVYRGMNKSKNFGNYLQEAFPYSKKENDLLTDFNKRIKIKFSSHYVYIFKNYEEFYANHFKNSVESLYIIPVKKITHDTEL